MPQYDKGRTPEEEEKFLRFRAARAAIRKRDAAGLIWCLLDLYMEDVAEGRKPDVSQKTFDKCLDVIGQAGKKQMGAESAEPGVDAVAAWLGENAH
jgi:hypothetical protein